MGTPLNLGNKKFPAFGKGRLPLPEEKNLSTVNYAVYAGSGALGASVSVSANVIQAAPLTFDLRLVSVEGYAWVTAVGGAVVVYDVLRMSVFNSSLLWNFQPIPGITNGNSAMVVAGAPYNNSLKMDFSGGIVNAYAGTNLTVELTFMKSTAFAGTESYSFCVKIGWQPL